MGGRKEVAVGKKCSKSRMARKIGAKMTKMAGMRTRGGGVVQGRKQAEIPISGCWVQRWPSKKHAATTLGNGLMKSGNCASLVEADVEK
jgi:hypothetical protein